MNKTLQHQVGQNIRRFRQEKGMTQQCLGYFANTSSSYIGHLENGRINPSLSTLERLAAVLDTEVWKLCLPIEDE